jgi:peptide/nickel transport system substrate-binding protein
LKKGVKFHDGHEFTAEDVKFTYDAINDVRNRSPWRTNTEMVGAWEIINKHTIKATLKKPFDSLLYKLVREIAPRHLLEGEEIAHALFNSHPVGTGPFRFEKWSKNNLIELEANADYFEGRPPLERIVIKTYQNIPQLWSAFMRQDIDLIKYLSRSNYLVLRTDPTFRTYTIPAENYYSVVYNLKDSSISNVNVRRAIAHAVNKKIIIEMTTGAGIESTGPFHPHSSGFNPEAKSFDYDPQKALEIFSNQGWRKDAHGVLRKKDRELVINLLIDSRKDIDRKIGMLMRQQLAEVGVKVKIKFYSGEKDLNSNPFERFEAQAWLRSLAGIRKGDDNVVAKYWYSRSSEFAKYGGYENKSVDQLFEEARTTRSENKTADIYKGIHRMIYEDQPACFLFYPLTYHAVSRNLHNTDEYFSVYMPTYTMKDWYVTKKHTKGGEKHGSD